MEEYVGLDVSKEETSYCIKDGSGGVVARGRVATDPAALFDVLRDHCLCPSRIVLETGCMSNWLVRELGKRGLSATCVDARQVHAVLRLKHHKTDANDAEVLAELARTGFYRAVAVKSETAQETRAVLVARDQLVRRVRDLDNAVRGILRSFGLRLPRGSGRFADRVLEALSGRPDLRPAIIPLLEARAGLRRAREMLDKEVRRRARTNPVCKRLMTAPGIGPITALAYTAVIDDPARFAKARSVGAYAGLTSRRFQSGEMDYSGRISKRGDALLRSLLFEAASTMLVKLRRTCPLRTWGLRLKKRLGHRKAACAVARKLAVILHRMWTEGADFRWPKPKEDAMATA